MGVKCQPHTYTHTSPHFGAGGEKGTSKAADESTPVKQRQAEPQKQQQSNQPHEEEQATPSLLLALASRQESELTTEAQPQHRPLCLPFIEAPQLPGATQGAHRCLYVCARTCMCMCACMCVRVHVCMYVRACACEELCV